jgi:hypothetical protein
MSSALCLLLLAAGSVAQDAQAPPDTPTPGWRWEFAPDAVSYPAYVADPRRPVFALTMIDVVDPDIPGAGDSRYGIRIGAQFGILDFVPPGERGGGLQLAGHVGFTGQFDRDSSEDNIGGDGLYGFHLAWRASPKLVMRIGMAHDSSHLGDEYIENTGANRLESTREECLAGVRFAPWTSLCAYAEYGYAYDLSNENLMEVGRAQCGLEYEPEPWLWNGTMAPFAALDLSAYEEDDWDPNVTVQVGLVHPAAGGGHWRFGLEFYDGRSVIGELFQSREQHVAFGVWLDL